MAHPIALLQAEAARALLRAAAELGVTDTAADRTALRFRPDGKGGELASPYPRICGIDSAELAHQLTSDGWWACVYPSRDWVAFDLAAPWDDLVRSWRAEPQSLPVRVPPMPSFPARLEPEDWTLCALLGRADPAVAARLDRSNPARRIRRALELARRSQGENRPRRRLINEAALVYRALDAQSPAAVARAMLTLAEAYLSQPGEDALVAQCLGSAAQSLQLLQFIHGMNSFSL